MIISKTALSRKEKEMFFGSSIFPFFDVVFKYAVGAIERDGGWVTSKEHRGRRSSMYVRDNHVL